MTKNGIDTTEAQQRLEEARRNIPPDQQIDEPKPIGKVLKTSSPVLSDEQQRVADQIQEERERVSREASEAEAERLRRAMLKHAHLPDLHQDAVHEHSEAQAKTMERVARFRDQGLIYILIGDRGRGKTQCCVWAAKEYMETAGKQARYATAMDFFMDVKATYSKENHDTEKVVINEYLKPGLLIIDAVEERSESPWENRLLSYLVDLRYRAQKDTLLSGNVAHGALQEALGHSIVSRCNEAGGVIEFEGDSFR